MVAQTLGMAVAEVSYCGILILILTDIQRLARKHPRAGSSRGLPLADGVFSISSYALFFGKSFQKK